MPKRDSSLPPFRREIERIAPYRVATAPHLIKLNQNESPIELPARLRRKILTRLDRTDWSRYPDYPAEELTRRIARSNRVAMNRVLIGHGSNELLYSLALTTLERRKTIVMPTPSYPVTALAATLAGATIRTVPLLDDFSYDVGALVRAVREYEPRLVFLPSPNNPTGTSIDRIGVERILQAGRSLVVVDEAYFQYSRIRLSSLLRRHDNLVLLRTLSKAFRLAGLRIGYILGHSEVLSLVERGKPPHSIDIFSQIAGEELFDHPGIIDREVERTVRERERLRIRIDSLPGVRVFPSDANFLLARFPDGRRVYEALLSAGILVRPVGQAPGTPRSLRNCLRITIGKRSENRALLHVLADYMMERRN